MCYVLTKHIYDWSFFMYMIRSCNINFVNMQPLLYLVLCFFLCKYIYICQSAIREERMSILINFYTFLRIYIRHVNVANIVFVNSCLFYCFCVDKKRQVSNCDVRVLCGECMIQGRSEDRQYSRLF